MEEGGSGRGKNGTGGAWGQGEEVCGTQPLGLHRLPHRSIKAGFVSMRPNVLEAERLWQIILYLLQAKEPQPLGYRAVMLITGFLPTALVAETGKYLPATLGREDPLEKAMVTHSSTLVWKIP